MNRKYFERDVSQLRTTPFGIYVDQAGYFPHCRKTAVMPFAADTFDVTDEAGSTVLSGSTSHHGFDEASGDDVYLADISALPCGRYRVNAGGKTSAVFDVAEDVYADVLRDTAKAFYYLRCGCRLEERYAGVYRHERCHCGKAQVWSDRSISRDVRGGWHDAGDYGRYVTAGACAAAHLLYAYRLFPDVLGKLSLDIPREDMPDILSETRYELEWLLKMQREDGGAYHKVTTMKHAPFVMPEEDTEQLYLFDVSSFATADLAAVAALAADVYSFDTEFAHRLRTAAERAAAWLDVHGFVGFANPDGCNTGSYGERDDISNRFWAYAELYSLTGEKQYHEKLLGLADDVMLTAFGYGEIGGLGALSYMLCSYDKNEALADKIRSAFAQDAAKLRDISDKSGYGSAMDMGDYHWGSNMTLMKNAMVMAADDIINGSDNKEYVLRQLHVLLGVNALGISYVTGTGEFRCNYPHLRPAFADGIEECIPGMVAGGPNARPADPFAYEVIAPGTPPMKCYADDAASYSLNEITIYWNSPAVFTLAYVQSRCRTI